MLCPSFLSEKFHILVHIVGALNKFDLTCSAVLKNTIGKLAAHFRQAFVHGIPGDPEQTVAVLYFNNSRLTVF